MQRLLFIIFIFAFTLCNAQKPNVPKCKVEIYLLNKYISSLDTIHKMVKSFTAQKEDLQDTAFIKDSEFVSYTIKRIKVENGKQRSSTREEHFIEVLNPLTEKLKNLNLALCCGKQFAFVVNGEIAYCGYFWNNVSSFAPMAVMAFGIDNQIRLQYGFKGQKDPRNNSILLDCFRQRNALIFE